MLESYAGIAGTMNREGQDPVQPDSEGSSRLSAHARFERDVNGCKPDLDLIEKMIAGKLLSSLYYSWRFYLVRGVFRRIVITKIEKIIER